MNPAWLYIGLAVVADGFAGLAGGLLSERWLRRRRAALIGFAAGALVAAAFVDVMPEAVDALGARGLWWAFAGFAGFAVVEWLLGPHHGHAGDDDAPLKRVVPAGLLLSDALHNVGDGASVAAAFLTSPALGVAVAVAVIAHELPQEVGDFVLLRSAGFRRGTALLALAGVQLTAILGAVGMVVAAGWSQGVVAVVLAVAAGTFLYIGATDLLPEVHAGSTTSDRRQRILGFAGGVAVILLTALFE